VADHQVCFGRDSNPGRPGSLRSDNRCCNASGNNRLSGIVCPRGVADILAAHPEARRCGQYHRDPQFVDQSRAKTGEEISDQVECGSVPPGSTRAGPTAWT
jgi:hypothetical protein